MYTSVDKYLSALCYCIDCQKVNTTKSLEHDCSQRSPNNKQWTGGASTSNAVVPRTSFKVTKGD